MATPFKVTKRPRRQRSPSPDVNQLLDLPDVPPSSVGHLQDTVFSPRLTRIAERLRHYEEKRPLTLALQRATVEGLHTELDTLEREECSDEQHALIIQLMETAESLLQDVPPPLEESSVSRSVIETSGNREHKAIDTRGLLRFDGRVLEYPEYRAGVQHSILRLKNRTSHEKYVAILKTIDPKVKTFLIGIDPNEPDLERVMQLLDERYLSGRAVELELKREIRRLPSVHPKSAEREWDEIHSAVSKLLLRVHSGDLNPTAERDMYHLLLQKLTETDQEAVALQGKNLYDFATKIEQFVVRAQVHAEKRSSRPTEPYRREHRPHGFSKYGHHDRPRVQTHTVIESACFFCHKNHEMKACPLALHVKHRKVRESGKCRRCLSTWNREHRCGQLCAKCKHPHHLSLCPQGQVNQNQNKPTPPVTNKTFLTSARSARAPCYLPSIRMIASSSQGQQLSVRVLLDPGSTTSYVSQTLAKALGAELREIPSQQVFAFGGTTRLFLDQETTLTLRNHLHTADVDLVLMPPNCVSPIDVPTETVARMARDYGVEFEASRSPLEEVDILLGVPHLNQHIILSPQHSVQLEGNLLAIQSRFGWYLQGVQNAKQGQSARTYLTRTPATSCMCQSIDQLLRDPLSSKNDGDLSSEQWILNALEHVTYDQPTKRWTVALPWLNETRPDNNRSAVYRVTEHQLRRIEERGQRAQYDEAIGVYLDGDFSERVYDSPAEAYYFTHHAVLKPGSTTAMRIVLNASFARKGERSLNDTLYKGYADQNNLSSLLLLWRLSPYAVTADLQKAFLQIRVRPRDRPFLRYFWAPSGSSKLQAYQMKSVLFGATASPCMLYLVIRKMFESAPEPEIRELYRRFYMDDCFFLGEDAQSVQRQIDVAKRILAEGSFPIHKWACPNWLTKEGFAVTECNEVVKCLGLRWNLTEDSITFSQPDIDCTVATRREVARNFGRLFDPHGLLGPFHTRQKLFMRRVLEQSKGWDTLLSDDLTEEAKVRFLELQGIARLKLPRAVRTKGAYEIVGFSDASPLAYGAVLYLQEAGKETMNVLISKSRLVSEKRTIPELELCAAVLLVELYASIRTDLPAATRVSFYTDSTVTLGRIRNSPNNYAQYVARRLAIIAKDSTAEQWHHVPTKLNPADALSRGLTLSELETHLLWFNGPRLSQLQETSERTFHISTIPTLSPAQAHQTDVKLLEMSYDKLIRFLMAYHRVMEGLLIPTDKENVERTSLDRLATAAAWRLFQRVVFPVEIKCLKKGLPLPRSSPFSNMNVLLCPRGIMRLNRRLENAPISYDAKYPIVAADHPFVRGFLDHFHAITMCHASLKATDQQVKTLFHLPQHYKILESIQSTCPKCQWLRGKAFNAPPAALPHDRVANENQHPFLHVGVDIFGPLESGQKKYYGLIFVCMNTRGVHLELLPSRTTTSILRAFERFVSRRGRPQVIRSDNEKGFRQLSSLLQDSKLREKIEKEHKLVWHFQPARSPFWGGFFERLVGVVKKSLANWPLIRRYTAEELSTILCSVEAMVNSRPLIAATNGSTYLTPADFLTGRPTAYASPLPLESASPVGDVLMNYVRVCEERDAMWTRLKREYLVSLRHFHRRDRTREPKTNELVLVVGSWKRETWSWGKIQSLMRGPDGVVRAVSLAMPNGEIWERPVQSIIPLEHSSREGGCGDIEVATEAASTTSANGDRSTPPPAKRGYKRATGSERDTSIRKSKRARRAPSRLRF